MASQLHNKVKEILKELYPLCPIEDEKVIRVGNRNLRIDLFVSDPFRIAVECQGRQHDEFVPFFHKSKHDFHNSKMRDSAKEAWCFDHYIPLIYVYEHEDINRELIKRKIEESERALDEYYQSE